MSTFPGVIRKVGVAPRIALATCRRLPEQDPDAEPLIEALRGLGARAEWLAWDDPDASLAGFDLCVIRSTWNYIHRLPDFLAWAERASNSTQLLNPLSVLKWNTDKAYLGDLKTRGIPVIDTAYVPKGGGRRLSAILSQKNWTDVVIKPRVGAASFATRRFSAESMVEAGVFLARHAEERDMLVQPYLHSVETHGERCLVWIADEITHAVRKTPRWEGGTESAAQAREVLPEERALALRALEPYARELLYARVDVARGVGGEPLIMELELVEPSLFLLEEPRALERFAARCFAAGQDSERRRVDAPQ